MCNAKRISVIFTISLIFILSFSVTALLADEAQIQLYTGWNLIGLPLNPAAPFTAESLGDAINAQGGNCERIQYWDGSEWVTHIINTPFGDYNIGTGRGYFVKCNSRSIFTIVGTPISAITLNLYPAWNSISVPVGSIDAEVAGNQINNEGGSCDTIIYWTGGGWEGHIIGMPFGDFTLTPGQGYFVLCDSASTWIPVPFGFLTAEEVLQKVSDNYRLVDDLKADMDVSTTLDLQPLGEKGYYIYYFKKPKKEKIETYSSSDRVNKVDITIIDGPTMYLVNPITKEVQTIDLLARSNIDSAQFNQMDIYYNLSEFLNGHTVTKNEGDSDLINFIIAIDALPKTTNSLYEKLELFADYKKGLLIKSLLFKDASLREKMEVQESQIMPNGAWVPVKMIKTPMLTSGNMVNTLIYSDIQINTGLSDDDFDPHKQ